MGKSHKPFQEAFKLLASCHVQVRRMAVTGVSWAAIEVLSCVKDEMCINTHTHSQNHTHNHILQRRANA